MNEKIMQALEAARHELTTLHGLEIPERGMSWTIDASETLSLVEEAAKVATSESQAEKIWLEIVEKLEALGPAPEMVTGHGSVVFEASLDKMAAFRELAEKIWQSVLRRLPLVLANTLYLQGVRYFGPSYGFYERFILPQGGGK